VRRSLELRHRMAPTNKRAYLDEQQFIEDRKRAGTHQSTPRPRASWCPSRMNPGDLRPAAVAADLQRRWYRASTGTSDVFRDECLAWSHKPSSLDRLRMSFITEDILNTFGRFGETSRGEGAGRDSRHPT